MHHVIQTLWGRVLEFCILARARIYVKQKNQWNNKKKKLVFSCLKETSCVHRKKRFKLHNDMGFFFSPICLLKVKCLKSARTRKKNTKKLNSKSKESEWVWDVNCVAITKIRYIWTWLNNCGATTLSVFLFMLGFFLSPVLFALMYSLSNIFI